jgi:TonB family protein
VTGLFRRGVSCLASENAVKPSALSIVVLFFASLLQAVSSAGQTVDPPKQEPLKIDAVTGFIHLLNKPELIYPKDALERHIEGRVELELTVSPQGDVVSERAVWGPLALRQAVIDAFKKAKYIPFTRDGKPSVALVQAIAAYEKDHAEISTESEHAITQLQMPAKTNNEYEKDVVFLSKGKAIQEATARLGSGGQGNRLGLGEQGRQVGNLEILSDTHGVDFGPYLQLIVLPHVRKSWYSAIPESVERKHGSVIIEFAITKDGKVAAMKLVASSGDTPLDRAAWAGIVSSAPFPPLPTEFRGQYLALRFCFQYNPTKEELAPAKSTASAPAVK